MSRVCVSLLYTAAIVVGVSVGQPVAAQARGGGMRVYEGRSAAVPRSSPRAGGLRVYERRPARRTANRPHAGGRHGFHRGKSEVFFFFPFGWFAFDPWMYAPYPAQPVAQPERPRRPSKVIEVTRGPAGVEVKVRYADDRQATLPAADTLPPR